MFRGIAAAVVLHLVIVTLALMLRMRLLVLLMRLLFGLLGTVCALLYCGVWVLKPRTHDYIALAVVVEAGLRVLRSDQLLGQLVGLLVRVAVHYVQIQGRDRCLAGGGLIDRVTGHTPFCVVFFIDGFVFGHDRFDLNLRHV